MTSLLPRLGFCGVELVDAPSRWGAVRAVGKGGLADAGSAQGARVLGARVLGARVMGLRVCGLQVVGRGSGGLVGLIADGYLFSVLLGPPGGIGDADSSDRGRK